MPKVVMPISDLDQSVTRPIMLDMIEQIRKETNLPNSAVVWYPGADGKAYQPRSTVAPDKNFVEDDEDAQANRLGGNPQLSIEVVENYDLDRTLGTATYQPENIFIFKDEALGVFIKPAYSYTDVTITIRFRARSETEAANWRNEMRQRVSMNRDVRLYDITYAYYIAPAYLAILQEIHRLRENVAGYGDTFTDYLKQYASSKLTTIVTSAGTMPRYTMPETQIEVQGGFDFDGFPETGERSEGGSTWTASFAFTFKYERPTTQVMFYPLMIHNQLLDQKWRPNVTPLQIRHQQKSYALSTFALKPFRGENTGYKAMMDFGYQVPAFDEFVPTSRLPNSKTVITLLLSLSTATPLDLFSLNEMGNFTLDPDIAAFMVGEAPYMTVAGQSIFHLHLYQGETIMTDGIITVDSNLNVASTSTLDYRQVYHARLVIRYDLLSISYAAQQRLQRHCAAANKIFDGLDGEIKFRPGLPVCVPGDYLRPEDYRKMNTIINRHHPGLTIGRQSGPIQSNFATLLIDADSRNTLPSTS